MPKFSLFIIIVVRLSSFSKMVELSTENLADLREKSSKKRKSKSANDNEETGPVVTEKLETSKEKKNVEERKNESVQKADTEKQGKRRKRKSKAGGGGTALGTDVGGFTVIGDVSQFRQSTVSRRKI